MSALGVLLIFLSAFCTAVANLMMRRGILASGAFRPASGSLLSSALLLMRSPLFVGGFLMYGLAAVIWFRVLPMENLTNSYPLLVSLTFLMVTIGAVIVFSEHVSVLKVAGLAVIIVGIALVSRG